MIEYSNSEILLLINDLVHSERDRNILKRRLVDGVPYDRIALEFSLSTRQIKRIVKRWRDTFNDRL